MRSHAVTLFKSGNIITRAIVTEDGRNFEDGKTFVREKIKGIVYFVVCQALGKRCIEIAFEKTAEVCMRVTCAADKVFDGLRQKKFFVGNFLHQGRKPGRDIGGGKVIAVDQTDDVAAKAFEESPVIFTVLGIVDDIVVLFAKRFNVIRLGVVQFYAERHFLFLDDFVGVFGDQVADILHIFLGDVDIAVLVGFFACDFHKMSVFGAQQYHVTAGYGHCDSIDRVVGFGADDQDDFEKGMVVFGGVFPCDFHGKRVVSVIDLIDMQGHISPSDMVKKRDFLQI